jgi:hypothetical protein
MNQAVRAGDAESVKYYNEWVEEVKRHVPEERLLEFRVQGQDSPILLNS